jgi:hypothetical protein
LASLKKTSDQPDLARVQLTTATVELQTTFSPDAPLAYRLDVALENFSESVERDTRPWRLFAAQSERDGPRQVRTPRA